MSRITLLKNPLFLVILQVLLVVSGVGLTAFALERPEDVSLSPLAVAHAIATLLVLMWRQDTSGDARSMRDALKRMLILAVPVTLVVVFTFTFAPGLARRFISPAPYAQTGFNFGAEMQPGSVASIAQSEEVALRAYFYNGTFPAEQETYWRGSVYTHSDGLSWSMGKIGTAIASDINNKLLASDKSIVQKIIVEPRPGRLLFALDWPFAFAIETKNETLFNAVKKLPGNTSLPPNVNVTQRIVAEVHSGDSPKLFLTPSEGEIYTQKPFEVPVRLQPFIDELKSHNKSFEDLEFWLQSFFKKSGFVYTLEPGTVDGKNELARWVNFLFTKRRGFCEHYAGALATMLRLAQIPSRVVVGFQGGVRNESLHVITVRDLDSHAWVEVYDEPTHRWRRLDATLWIDSDESAAKNNRISLRQATWFGKAFEKANAALEPLRIFGVFASLGLRSGEDLSLVSDMFVSLWKIYSELLVPVLFLIIGFVVILVFLLRSRIDNLLHNTDELLLYSFRSTLKHKQISVFNFQGPIELARIGCDFSTILKEQILKIGENLNSLLYSENIPNESKKMRKETKILIRKLKKELK